MSEEKNFFLKKFVESDDETLDLSAVEARSQPTVADLAARLDGLEHLIVSLESKIANLTALVGKIEREKKRR